MHYTSKRKKQIKYKKIWAMHDYSQQKKESWCTCLVQMTPDAGLARMLQVLKVFVELLQGGAAPLKAVCLMGSWHQKLCLFTKSKEVK